MKTTTNEPEQRSQESSDHKGWNPLINLLAVAGIAAFGFFVQAAVTDLPTNRDVETLLEGLCPFLALIAYSIGALGSILAVETRTKIDRLAFAVLFGIALAAIPTLARFEVETFS